jgi:ADP-ribose pyrophosphatase YjhB (NUDIX family)
MLTRPTTHSQMAERVKRLFGVAPCRLQVAALPWREGKHGLEIMLITSRDTGRWVLPKGWPEAREPLCDAAAREAGEEAGLRGFRILRLAVISTPKSLPPARKCPAKYWCFHCMSIASRIAGKRNARALANGSAQVRPSRWSTNLTFARYSPISAPRRINSPDQGQFRDKCERLSSAISPYPPSGIA